eukprot:6211262-Heterocapsa_arctica.AAC.1
MPWGIGERRCRCPVVAGSDGGPACRRACSCSSAVRLRRRPSAITCRGRCAGRQGRRCWSGGVAPIPVR